MKEKIIESKSNPYLKELVALIKKGGSKKESLVAVEGIDFLDLAYEKDVLKLLISSYSTPLYQKVKHYVIPREVMARLSQNNNEKALIGIVKLDYQKELKGNRFIYLDDVQDPGNVGTIIRTALAFNYDGVILSNKSASIYNNKVIASSKGAIFKISLYRDIMLESLKGDYDLIAATLESASNYKDIDIPTRFILIVGNEGQGVKKENLVLADKKIYIPQDNIDSLNVAVAAGILLNHLRGK